MVVFISIFIARVMVVVWAVQVVLDILCLQHHLHDYLQLQPDEARSFRKPYAQRLRKKNCLNSISPVLVVCGDFWRKDNDNNDRCLSCCLLTFYDLSVQLDGVGE